MELKDFKSTDYYKQDIFVEAETSRATIKIRENDRFRELEPQNMLSSNYERLLATTISEGYEASELPRSISLRLMAN